MSRILFLLLVFTFKNFCVIGLTNFGNSCYMSAAVQFLYNLKDLTEAINKRYISQAIPVNTLPSIYAEFVHSYLKDPQHIEQQTRLLFNAVDGLLENKLKPDSLSLENLVNYIPIKCERDATEAIYLIINSLREMDELIVKKFFLIGLAHKQIIAGQSEIDPEPDAISISLPVKASPLQQVYEENFALLENEGYSSRWRIITHFPEYIFFELKRLNFDQSTKTIKFSDVPIIIPDMFTFDKKWVSDDITIPTLEFIGAIIHSGGTSGHYTAYIKDQFDPQEAWWICDDRLAKNLTTLDDSRKNQIATHATLLVYKKLPEKAIHEEASLKSFYQDLTSLAGALANS